MGDIRLNTHYLQTNRGIIKIVQIIIGFIICSLLCGSWLGGRSCFGDGKVGFASGLNFVCVIINIVLFIINFLNIAQAKLERLYSVVCCVLFLVASGLMIWYVIEYDQQRGWPIAAGALIIAQFFLYLWDVKILQGEAYN